MLKPVLILAALTIVGCAGKPAPEAQSVPVRRPLPPAASTTALAFTPALAADADELSLDRDGRQTVAYAGYEQKVLDVTYTRQDDRQRSGRNGHDQSYFERRSVSTSITVRGN